MDHVQSRNASTPGSHSAGDTQSTFSEWPGSQREQALSGKDEARGAPKDEEEAPTSPGQPGADRADTAKGRSYEYPANAPKEGLPIKWKCAITGEAMAVEAEGGERYLAEATRMA